MLPLYWAAILSHNCMLPRNAVWRQLKTKRGAYSVATYDKHDIVSNKFWLWEATLSEFLFDRAQAGDVFVDIGANVGVHSVRAAVLGLSVIAIEAMPQNVALLRATKCRNKDLNITIIPFAVGPPGVCKLYSDPENFGDCHLVCNGEEIPKKGNIPYPYRGEVEVKAANDLIPANTKFLKVDIEGSECNVFDHLEHTPHRLAVEVTWQRVKHCVNRFSKKYHYRAYKHGADVYLSLKQN